MVNFLFLHNRVRKCFWVHDVIFITETSHRFNAVLPEGLNIMDIQTDFPPSPVCTYFPRSSESFDDIMHS